MQERTTYRIRVYGGATKATFEATFLGMPTADELLKTIGLLGPAQAKDEKDVIRWIAIVKIGGFDTITWTDKKTSEGVYAAGMCVGTIAVNADKVYEPLRSTSTPGIPFAPCQMHGPSCPYSACPTPIRA